MVWLDNLPAGRHPLFSEPLASWLWSGFATLLRTLQLPVDARHLAILPILSGVLAISIARGIAHEIVPGRNGRVTTLALLGTLGVSQLYFGHIESYPLISVFILAYLYLGLRRARGRDSPALLAISLAAAISSHLIALYLAPSYLLTVVTDRRPPWQRVALVLMPLLLAASALALLGFRVEDFLRPFWTIQAGVGGGSAPHFQALRWS